MVSHLIGNLCNNCIDVLFNGIYSFDLVSGIKCSFVLVKVNSSKEERGIVMTRQERVKMCIDILDRYEEETSFWNLRVLDELSDEDLYNEEKIVEKINIIRNHRERIENNSNRYPEHIMECVRQNLGLERFDAHKDEYINRLSPDEVFNRVCDWNGLIGYAPLIKIWIEDIYKVNLDDKVVK